MKSYVKILLYILICASVNFASQEGIVQAKEISFHSDGIGNSGPIQVQLYSGKNGAITSFRINAFGKSVDLTKAEISKIPKFTYNGINVSYERGYVDVGGQTLYIILSSRFSESVLRETMIIFSETSPVEIFEKTKRERPNCKNEF